MFGEVLVVDEGDLRSLRFGDVDGDDQSTISLSDPAAVPMEYVRYAALGLLYVAHPKRALVVGLGGGTFPALLRRALPDLRIDAVEIDPAVIDAAKKFFAVREDARYVIHLGDGRAFVEHAKTRWDLVLLDAYGGDGVPAPLATREFFAAVRARLAPGGAVVANLFSHDPAGERSLVATFAAVFPSIACFRTPDRLNRVLIGRADAKPGAPPTPAPTYDRDALAARAKDLGARLKLSFDLADPAARVGTGCEALDFTAPVLRDAPRVAP
jgi:spermidine synthase